MSTTARHIPLALLLAIASGCYSGLDASGSGASADGSASDGQSGSATESGGETDGESESDTNDDGGPTSELPSPTTRFFRLTHQQWENTIQDLFYLPEPTGLSSYFRSDTPAQGYLFANDAKSLSVDGALWSGYQLAAVDTAELVVADPGVMAGILPVDGGDDAARADTFIRDFGLRAFRRPLSEGEVAEYFALYGGADGLYEDTTGFDAGIRLVIETMLQSPHFIYRIEKSEEPDGEVIPLDSFEVASRLSYFLWDTMPDDALFEAAVADELNAGMVREHAARMLDDGRAQPVVEYFHDVVFESQRMQNAAPSTAVYPDVPADIGMMAAEEFRLFVADVILAQGAGVNALFTSNETFVNAELAAIYGVDGPAGAEFEKVTLPADRRKGVLTQVGFLVANASAVNPDPIHRGKFLADKIVCAELPAPPDMIPELPEPAPGQTNRQTIEDLTEAPGSNCAGCHATLINPFGFPFENYDAVGAFRTEDNGQPVDPSSSVILDGSTVDVANGIALVDALAASSQVHECYVKHWVEYAHGRPLEDLDEPLLERLGEMSVTDDTSVKNLLIEVVVSQPFLTRATEELP